MPCLTFLCAFGFQYSQMRDEVFKSNLVCAFIVLFFITGIQSLLPSARYTIHNFSIDLGTRVSIGLF